MQLEHCLLYLATLKGLSTAEAQQRLGALPGALRPGGSTEAKKVKELSKGMQQKAQIINTVLHQPELIIVDEPFTALDPVNTQLVKDLMRELREEGATILMSTHQMHQVEELCDRIVLINQGRNVLYGGLDDIRRQYAGHAVLVRTTDELPRLPGVREVSQRNGEWRLALAEGLQPQAVLEALVARRVELERFEVAMPTLGEIFVRVVEGGA